MSDLTKEEFCERFTAEMIRLIGPTYLDVNEYGETIEDVCKTADYSDEISATYWEEPDQRADGPEACAQSEYSYWE